MSQLEIDDAVQKEILASVRRRKEDRWKVQQNIVNEGADARMERIISPFLCYSPPSNLA